MEVSAEKRFEVRPLTEQTASDFKSVVSRMFSPGATGLIDYILTNPLRSRCSSCGDIVYEEGIPVCVQAAILRKMYFGQKPFVGVIGGFLARIPEASPETLLKVIACTLASRGDSRLFFANTAMPVTVKLYRLLGVKLNGGETWKRSLVCPLRPLTYWYFSQCERHPRLPQVHFSALRLEQEQPTLSCVGSVSVKRQLSFDHAEFDDLWGRYLKGNKGIVSSRDKETLNWIFGRQLDEGRALLFCAYEYGVLIGFIVVNRTTLFSRAWRVVDALAINDDLSTIDLLLKGAIGYVKTKAKAVSIGVMGFPAKVETVLRSNFDKEVARLHNPFLISSQCEDSFNQIVQESLRVGWFGTPYDGDMIL